MLLLRLWNFMRGYVIILVEGYFLEKFINICIHRQILLWDIKRHKNCYLTLKLSINGFRMLRPIAKKTNCRVRIVKKKGLPFVLNRYKRRKAFLFGAVIFVVLFYILSSFIWSIEVTGNKKLESQVIVDKLSALGVKPGKLKYNIDTEEAANYIMANTKELSWVGVVVKGTKVKVEVAEGVKPPSLVPKNIACNIVATKDAIIKSIITKTGFAMVKEGDTVVKGQVLISGSVPNKDEKIEPIFVHAIGTVKARTWYEKSCPVNIKAQDKQRTGKIKNNYSLVLFTKKINLFHGNIAFESYDKIEIKKKLSIGRDLVFPFEVVIEKYYEENLVEKEVSLDEAKEIAADSAYKEAEKEIPDKVEMVSKIVDFAQKEDGQLIANIVIECIEDIGVTKEIGGN